MARQRKDYTFNPEKLQELTAPFKVYCFKMEGDRKVPLELPAGSSGHAVNDGWCAADVAGRLNNLVVPELFGAGDYHLQAYDGAKTYEWRIFFSSRQVSEKIPPSLRAANGQQPPAPQQQFAQSGGPPPPSGGSDFDIMGEYAKVRQPQGYGGSNGQQTYTLNTSGVQAQGPSLIPPRSQLDELWEDKIRALKLEAALDQSQKQRGLEDQIAQARRELDDRKRLEEAAKPVSDNERFMRDQLAQLKQEAAEAKRVQEQRDMEQRFRAELAAQREESNRRFEQIMQQQQQTLAAIAAAPKGPDPMLTMIMEMNRQSVEGMKESARLQAEHMRSQPTFMDMLRTAREMQEANGMGGITKNIGEAFAVVTGSLKQISAMQAPPSSVWDNLAPVIAEKVGDIGQAMATNARDVQVAKANAEVMKVQANAQAVAQMQANNQALAVRQQQLGEAQAQQAWSPPPQVTDSPETRKAAADARESDLFGPALMPIRVLRKSVAEGKLNPTQAAQSVVQGVKHFRGKGQPIKAFQLYEEKTWPALVELLLPDVERNFRAAMISELDRLSKGGPESTLAEGNEPAETEEDDDGGGTPLTS